MCEDMTRIEKINQINSEMIAEKYIRNQIPVIIGSDIMTRELKGWPIADHYFDFEDLEKVIEIAFIRKISYILCLDIR